MKFGKKALLTTVLSGTLAAFNMAANAKYHESYVPSPMPQTDEQTTEANDNDSAVPTFLITCSKDAVAGEANFSDYLHDVINNIVEKSPSAGRPIMEKIQKKGVEFCYDPSLDKHDVLAVKFDPIHNRISMPYVATYEGSEEGTAFVAMKILEASIGLIQTSPKTSEDIGPLAATYDHMNHLAQEKALVVQTSYEMKLNGDASLFDLWRQSESSDQNTMKENPALDMHVGYIMAKDASPETDDAVILSELGLKAYKTYLENKEVAHQVAAIEVTQACYALKNNDWQPIVMDQKAEASLDVFKRLNPYMTGEAENPYKQMSSLHYVLKAANVSFFGGNTEINEDTIKRYNTNAGMDFTSLCKESIESPQPTHIFNVIMSWQKENVPKIRQWLDNQKTIEDSVQDNAPSVPEGEKKPVKPIKFRGRVGVV